MGSRHCSAFDLSDTWSANHPSRTTKTLGRHKAGAFDVDWLLQELDERGAIAVIPPKANRKMQRDYDTHMYKWRYLIENYFAKIKEFRSIATRYDKTDTSYAANWYLTATLIAAR